MKHSDRPHPFLLHCHLSTWRAWQPGQFRSPSDATERMKKNHVSASRSVGHRNNTSRPLFVGTGSVGTPVHAYIHTYSKKGGSLTTTSQQQHCTASGERYPRQTVSPADRLDGSPRKAIDQYTVEAVRFTGPQCCRGAVSFRNRARASSVAASSSRNRKGCQRGTRVHLYLPTENNQGGSDLKTRPGLYVSQVLSGDAGDVHRIPPTLSSVDRWSLRAWTNIVDGFLQLPFSRHGSGPSQSAMTQRVVYGPHVANSIDV